MKKLLSTLVLITGLAASAQAATVIVGVDAGYLIDSEEEYLSARLGFEVARTGNFAHHLEFEVGYTDDKEGGIKADLVPLTANYRFTAPASGQWSYYAGAGLGIARARIDGVSIFGPITLRDEAFAVQAFGGFTYQASPAVALTVGAKYLWVDDVTFASRRTEVGDDVAVTAGISFRF